MADEVGGHSSGWFNSHAGQGDDDLVFAHPQTGGPLTKPNITRRMRAAMKAAKLDTAHAFHDVRHTFGTQMPPRHPDADAAGLDRSP
jgi:site-specific recombinase XerD